MSRIYSISYLTGNGIAAADAVSLAAQTGCRTQINNCADCQNGGS